MSYATEKPIAGRAKALESAKLLDIDTKIRISKNELVDLGNFTAADVDLESISRSLNNLKRFTGHYAFNKPLTVAQHTLLTMWIAHKLYPDNSGTQLMCLIHDMPEAYYGDLSSPLKRFLGDLYREKIKEIDKTIYDTLWEPASWDSENKRYRHSWFDHYKQHCKYCDHISLRIEQNMLFGTVPPEDYVQQFMQKNDTRRMFERVSLVEDIDLEELYKNYATPTFPF